MLQKQDHKLCSVWKKGQKKCFYVTEIMTQNLLHLRKTIEKDVLMLQKQCHKIFSVWKKGQKKFVSLQKQFHKNLLHLGKKGRKKEDFLLSIWFTQESNLPSVGSMLPGVDPTLLLLLATSLLLADAPLLLEEAVPQLLRDSSCQWCEVNRKKMNRVN